MHETMHGYMHCIYKANCQNTGIETDEEKIRQQQQSKHQNMFLHATAHYDDRAFNVWNTCSVSSTRTIYICVCTTSIEFQCPIYLIFISLHYKTCNTEETLYLVSSDHGFIFEEYSLRLAK